MSFLGSAFSGVQNNYAPQSGYAPGTQATVQSFAPQIATANTNYDTANTGLNTLAESLRQQMNGGGPNLANAQLQQATGQNIANQAAMQAGQRGASSNVGLIARQAGQQGANIQQQAAGQSAINRLQQQLMAQAQLGNVYGTQGGLANQNYGITQGAQTAQNQNITNAIGGQSKTGAQIAQNNAQTNQGLLSGIAQGGMSMLGLADGGQVPTDPDIQAGPSQFGQNFLSGKKPDQGSGGVAQMIPMMAVAASGGQANKLPFMPIDFRSGGRVPGQPKVSGNSVKNDTVPAMLSPKEIVIPNSVTQSEDPVGKGAQFIANEMRKNKK